MARKRGNVSHYKHTISKFKNKKILVIGDVILDQHIWGSVSRISPEAPVLIVLQKGEPSFAPGAAANVANNLRTLGAKVTLVGRIGADSEGKMFLEGLRKRKIATRGIFIDKKNPTILKTRIIAQRQQVLRLDREKVDLPLDSHFLKKILGFIERSMASFDAVIISDYGKGLISRELIEHICNQAKTHKKILTVDPKVENFVYYRGVTSITPNRMEAENAIRNIKITHENARKLGLNSDCLQTRNDIERAGQQLLKFLGLESLLITLGEHGMCLFEKGKPPQHIPTKAKEVFDVTGAGDTVIAVFTLALATGTPKLEAADLANYAAGIVVGRIGTASLSPQELLAATKE